MDVLSWQEFVAGWVGGVAGLGVGHPADTIKVRQQAFNENVGVLKTLRTTIKYEGIRGLYKGMSFPLLSTGALNALFFGVYANTLRQLEQRQRTDGDPKSFNDEEPPARRSSNANWSINVFAAGCVGGLFACFLACPIDLIKIQMQSQTGTTSCKEWGRHHEPQHKGMVDCIRRLCHSQGIRGLYTGLCPMLLRDVPSYGLYMLAYEHLICSVANKGHIHDFKHQGTLVLAGGSADVVSYGVYMLVYETGLRKLHCNHVITTLISGGSAGVISWALITPLDLIKSRIQADDIKKPVYKGVIDCAKKSYQANGLPVFFRGFSMMMLRSFPVNAATFLVYESTLHLLGPSKSSDTYPILHHD